MHFTMETAAHVLDLLLLLVAVSLLYKTQLTSHHTQAAERPELGRGGEADAFAQFVLNSLKDTSFFSLELSFRLKSQP